MGLTHRIITLAAIMPVFLVAGCKTAPERQKLDFSKVTEDFVYGSLALTPVSATQAGYHEHQGVKLDEKLDDFSPSGIEAEQKFYTGFKDRLAGMDQASLSAEERADYLIIQNAVELSLQDLQQIQSYRHNPTTYVELIGNALFNPYVLEYAPFDTRFAQIIKQQRSYLKRNSLNCCYRNFVCPFFSIFCKLLVHLLFATVRNFPVAAKSLPVRKLSVAKALISLMTSPGGIVDILCLIA